MCFYQDDIFKSDNERTKEGGKEDNKHHFKARLRFHCSVHRDHARRQRWVKGDIGENGGHYYKRILVSRCSISRLRWVRTTPVMRNRPSTNIHKLRWTSLLSITTCLILCPPSPALLAPFSHLLTLLCSLLLNWIQLLSAEWLARSQLNDILLEINYTTHSSQADHDNVTVMVTIPYYRSFYFLLSPPRLDLS